MSLHLRKKIGCSPEEVSLVRLAPKPMLEASVYYSLLGRGAYKTTLVHKAILISLKALLDLGVQLSCWVPLPLPVKRSVSSPTLMENRGMKRQ